MIDIRTFRSKGKGIRVDIYRKFLVVDEVTQKSKPSLYRRLGALSLHKEINKELLELLQPDEHVQLQNWLADATFAEQFNVAVDSTDLEKFPIRIPKAFYDNLINLHFEAKNHGIAFTPNQIMLEALAHHAKKVQSLIDEKNLSTSKEIHEGVT